MPLPVNVTPPSTTTNPIPGWGQEQHCCCSRAWVWPDRAAVGSHPAAAADQGCCWRSSAAAARARGLVSRVCCVGSLHSTLSRSLFTVITPSLLLSAQPPSFLFLSPPSLDNTVWGG